MEWFSVYTITEKSKVQKNKYVILCVRKKKKEWTKEKKEKKKNVDICAWLPIRTDRDGRHFSEYTF